MGGLNAALNSGKTSLLTNQKAIEITGLNVANVNTPGYSRQTPYLTPYPSLVFGDYFIGTGVTVGEVQRSHDVFLAGQINDKGAEFGFESSQINTLAEIEREISVGDDSLSAEIDQFFDAWRQLSTNPGGEVERQQVLQRGALLADKFHNIDTGLDQVVNNINIDLAGKLDGINQRLYEIADLNNRISAIEMSGQSANSDRDRRDLLLKELSETLGVTGFETSTGTLSVQLPNGMPLVEGDIVSQVEGFYSGTSFQMRLNFGATNIDLDRTALGGEVGGLFQVRDVVIPDVRNRLDTLAFEISGRINTQHQLGTGLDGVSSRDFFVPLAGVAGASSSIELNLTQTYEIAAGMTNAPGDNTNALAILDLETAQTIGNDSFVSYYGKIAATVGVETARNRQAKDGLRDSLDSLNNLRDSIDGVSLEEEMINLLEYQKGYEASAKFLSTVDEMLDTLMTLKR